MSKWMEMEKERERPILLYRFGERLRKIVGYSSVLVDAAVVEFD